MRGIESTYSRRQKLHLPSAIAKTYWILSAKRKASDRTRAKQGVNENVIRIFTYETNRRNATHTHGVWNKNEMGERMELRMEKQAAAWVKDRGMHGDAMHSR